MTPGMRLSSFYLLQAKHTGDIAVTSPPEYPRTFAFDFQIVLMSSCIFLFFFSFATPNLRSAELLCISQKEKRRQQNHITQAEVQNPDWTPNMGTWLSEALLWSSLERWCWMCGTGTQLSETGTPSPSLKAETINHRTWHARGLQRTIKSNLAPSVQDLNSRVAQAL